MDQEDQPQKTCSAHPTDSSVGSILAWSVWIGLICGSLELAIFWIKCHWLDPRNLNVSRQMVWMYPLAGLMVIGGSGIGLAIGSRAWKPLSRRPFVLYVLFFFAYVGLTFRAPIYTSVCLLLAAGMAWKSMIYVKSCASWLNLMVVRRVWVPLTLFGCILVASLGRESWVARPSKISQMTSAAQSRSKNVLLIVLDTVRAQSLSLYGYPKDTSPNLTKFARRGVRFDRAFSTAPWTAPSHASLFTGRWPHELTIGWDQPLDQTFPTLAEELGSRGYSTAGFVANTTYCSYETGLSRGFAHYEDYDVTLRGIWQCSSLVERSLNFLHKHPNLARWMGDGGSSTGDRKDASRINRDFLGWLDVQTSGRPFFAFLNFYDAHHPYLSPDPERAIDLGRKPRTPRDFRLIKTWWERDKVGLKPDDLCLARDSYDRCIAYLDDQLGQLFDELAKRGVLEDTLVIVTADHGEHLGERDLYGHGCSVYRPELHVPLLMIAPGKLPEGQVIVEPVSLRDVPLTVMNLLGYANESKLSGKSLAKLAIDGADQSEKDRLVLSEVRCPPEDDPNGGRSPASKGPMTSMVSREFHYIQNGDGREELFQIVRDPDERVDLSQNPEMTTILERFRRTIRR